MRFRRVLPVTALLLIPLLSQSQDDSRRYKTGQIQVGDRVLADPVNLGKPDKCTVIGPNELTGQYMPGYTNQYQIRCDKEAWSTLPATGDKVKLSVEPNVLTGVRAIDHRPGGRLCVGGSVRITGPVLIGSGDWLRLPPHHFSERYKTTFGDWNCSMNDVFKSDADKHFNIAPPRP